MSAIAGIVSLGNSDGISCDTCRTMLEAMRPEDLDTSLDCHRIQWCDAVFGCIGYQPDASHALTLEEESDSCVAWVGELYHDAPLALSDPVWLLGQYHRRGVDRFAQETNGSFAAAVADAQTRTIVLMTDHTASQALFTCLHDGKLYFASEVKGLLALADLPRSPDEVTILSFLTNGYFLARRTLIREIRQMDYATLTIIKNQQINTRKYWQYVVESEADHGRKVYIRELAELLRTTVRRRTRRGRCGILLSGGIDSRGILCCMDHPEIVPALSYSQQTGHACDEATDWAIARRIAASLNMSMHLFPVHPEQCLAALGDSARSLDGAAGFVFENVWDRIRDEVGVEYCLVGDECLGWTTGITPHRRVLPAIGIQTIPENHGLLSFLAPEGRRHIWEEYEQIQSELLHSCRGKNPYDHVDQLYMEQRLIHYILPKRRLIQRHGIFVRNPWLDRDVMDFMRTSPTKYRIRKKLFRDTLRHINRALWALPRASAGISPDWGAVLAAEETSANAVSERLAPLGSFGNGLFDMTQVRSLVAKVCQPSIQKDSWRHKWLHKFPPALYPRLVAWKKYFHRPILSVSDTRLLLRLLTLAEVIHQVRSAGRRM